MSDRILISKRTPIRKRSHHHLRSLYNQHHRLSTVKTRFKKTIHITIRSTNDIQRTNNNIHSSSGKTCITDNRSERSQESKTKIYRINSKTESYKKPSSKVAHYDNVLIDNCNHTKRKNAWSDDIDVINNHHRKAKKNRNKKCTRRCALASVISILIIASILLIVLLCFYLTKSKTTTTTQTPLLRWNSNGITLIGTSGQPGNTTRQLYNPWDLALDWSNALYVSDQRNHRVLKFLMGATQGTTIAGYGNGTGDSTLSGLRGPLGIAVDDNSNIYISDTSNQRVVTWSNGALFGSLFAGNGTTGSSMNQLNAPYGIEYDTNSGTIYVAEYGNDRIMRFSRTNTSGILVAGGNGNGKNNTQLSLPHAVHFDTLSNSLIIANTGAHNIVHWVLDANNWTLIAGSINGTSGISSTHLQSPTDVTLDPMGNIYVVDRFNHRIQFFLSGESNATTIAGITGVTGSNSTLFNTPTSLVLDNQLNLYVVDRANYRIQKFLRY